jgi:hypothetical protein
MWVLSSFKKYRFLLISEGEGEGERDRNINDDKRESLTGCLLHVLYWGSSPQPRHVPLARMEPRILHSAGRRSIH